MIEFEEEYVPGLPPADRIDLMTEVRADLVDDLADRVRMWPEGPDAARR